MFVRPWSVLAVAAVVTLAGQAYAHSAPGRSSKSPEVAKKVTVERSRRARANAPEAATHANAKQHVSRAKKQLHKAKAKAAVNRLHRAQLDQRHADRLKDHALRREELKQNHPRFNHAVRDFRRHENVSDHLPDGKHIDARKHSAARDQLTERKHPDIRVRRVVRNRLETKLHRAKAHHRLQDRAKPNPNTDRRDTKPAASKAHRKSPRPIARKPAGKRKDAPRKPR